MSTNKLPIDRFMEKVRETGDGCWEWTAYVGRSGYGRFSFQDRGAMAHRWSFEFYIERIPVGLVLDHLCRNRACVNPWHLEPVTHEVNVRRGIPAPHNREKTSCPKGHPYDESNTYANNGGRTCRVCKRENARADYLRNRERVIERSRMWAVENPSRAREMSREAQSRYRARKNERAA